MSAAAITASPLIELCRRAIALTPSAGATEVEYEGQKLDFAHVARYSMREAVVHFWEGEGRPSMDQVADAAWLSQHSAKATAGEALADIFERHVEAALGAFERDSVLRTLRAGQ